MQFNWWQNSFPSILGYNAVLILLNQVMVQLNRIFWVTYGLNGLGRRHYIKRRHRRRFDGLSQRFRQLEIVFFNWTHLDAANPWIKWYQIKSINSIQFKIFINLLWAWGFSAALCVWEKTYCSFCCQIYYSRFHCFSFDWLFFRGAVWMARLRVLTLMTWFTSFTQEQILLNKIKIIFFFFFWSSQTWIENEKKIILI